MGCILRAQRTLKTWGLAAAAQGWEKWVAVAQGWERLQPAEARS